MNLIFEAVFVGRSHRSKDTCSLQVFYSPKEKKLAFEKLFDNRQSSNQEFDFIKEKDVAKKIIDEVLVTGREFIMKNISVDEYKIEKRIPEKVFTERKLKENSLLFGFDVAGNEWIKVYIDNDAFWISNDMYEDRTHFQQMFDYKDTTLEKCFDRAMGSPVVLHIGQVKNNTVKEHLSNWLRFGEKKYPVAGKELTREVITERVKKVREAKNNSLDFMNEANYGKQNTLFGDSEEVFYDTDKVYKEIVRYVESRFNFDILKRELKVNIKDLAEHIYDLYLDYLSENPRSRKENINSLLDSLIDEELFEEYTLQRYFSTVIDLIENKVEKEIDEDNLLSQFKDNFPKNEVFRNMDIERNNDKETIDYLVKDIGINISDLEKYILKTKPNLIYSMPNIVYSNDEKGSYNLISFFEKYDYIDLGESLTDALEKANTYFPDTYTTIERELSSIGSFEKNKVMKVYLDIDYAVSIDYKVVDEYLESRRV